MKQARTFLIHTSVMLVAVTAGVLLARKQATARFAPSPEMAAAFSEMDPFRRFAIGLRCIERQKTNGCADLAEFLERREIAASFGGPELFRAVLYRWGQCDPQRAITFLQSTRQTDQLALSHAAVLFGWLDTDTPTALAWCRAHPWPAFDLSGEALSWTEHSWRALAERDLDSALRLLEAYEIPAKFDGVAPFLHVTRPPHETPWLGPHPPNGETPEASYRYEQRWIGLVLAWSQEHPLAAYRWLVNAQNTPVGTDAVIQILLARWFREEPARAADLVVYENRGNRWLDGFEPSLRLWARRDSAAFLRWVRKLPPDIADDGFRMRRASSVMDANPDLALDLALGIKDANLRIEIIEDCMSVCRKHFPSAFPEWLKAHESQIPQDARRPVTR